MRALKVMFIITFICQFIQVLRRTFYTLRKKKRKSVFVTHCHGKRNSTIYNFFFSFLAMIYCIWTCFSLQLSDFYYTLCYNHHSSPNTLHFSAHIYQTTAATLSYHRHHCLRLTTTTLLPHTYILGHNICQVIIFVWGYCRNVTVAFTSVWVSFRSLVKEIITFVLLHRGVCASSSPFTRVSLPRNIIKCSLPGLFIKWWWFLPRLRDVLSSFRQWDVIVFFAG